MIKLNDYFDKIYCINMDIASDRWNLCLEQFKKYDIDVERFSAIVPNNGNNGLLKGEIGVLRSNLEIIKLAKENNYKNVLILEDDFEFIENFNFLFDEQIKQVPENWDFLYFGGNHMIEPLKISENIFKMFHTYALHTFAVNKTMYDQILNTISKEKKQVDVYYAEMMPTTNAYVFRPHLSFQKIGFSYIQNRITNYDNLLKK